MQSAKLARPRQIRIIGIKLTMQTVNISQISLRWLLASRLRAARPLRICFGRSTKEAEVGALGRDRDKSL